MVKSYIYMISSKLRHDHRKDHAKTWKMLQES